MTALSVRLTVFTSTHPPQLGKTFHLEGSKVTKTTAGNMSAGTFEVAECNGGSADFAALLASVETNQAICSSIPSNGSTQGSITTVKRESPGAIARTRKNFHWPAAPAFICLDCDAPKDGKPLTIGEALATLLSVCPAAAHAPVIAYPSGSSEIWETRPDGADIQHRGITGAHLYVLALDGSDTERFGKTLAKRLWLAGMGRVEVSSSGSLLIRSTFDEAVHQPARLIFSGGAVCHPPLSQRRGSPLILADGPHLDTRAALPDLTAEEESQYQATIAAAKAKAEPSAKIARDGWIESRVKAGLAEAVASGADLNEAKVRISRTLEAALGGALLGSFPLIIVDDEGTESTVTVDQVLADRERFHLAHCLDPLSPDHRDRAPDCLLYTCQAQPAAFSLNDGGVLYRLLRQPTRLAVVAGEKARLAEQIANYLAHEPDLFTSGGQLVRTARGTFAPLSRPLLQYQIGCSVALYRQTKEKQVPAEPDAPLLDMVAALLPERLQAITGRSTHPLITADGRVIVATGFDSKTGIYLDLKPDEEGPPPAHPTHQATVTALRRLWAPWSAYKWAGPHDRAAMLATVLTIPLRPTIDAAPGLFADAASQAAGKSKAIGAVAALARGHRGGMKTWQSDSEAELEKYLLSVTRSADPVIAFDNVQGIFRSACLANSMAEGKLNIRLLGVNEAKTPDARVMWLASGNQYTADRDMSTRWLIARIDPGTEHPQMLTYAFDPVDRALADRLGIIHAAITLHLAYHQAGCPRADRIDTRFATWGRTVRQLCLWLRDSGIAAEAGIGELGDPAHATLSGSIASDQESEALALLLSGLMEQFGADAFTASEVRRLHERGESGSDTACLQIHEGLSGLLPRDRLRNLSAQSVNWALKNRRGRICGGLKLVDVPGIGTARGAVWRVVPVPSS